MKNLVSLLAAALLVLTASALAQPADPQIKVRPDHPRLFFRTGQWDGGLTVEKVKSWMGRPEYKAHYADLKGPAGDALRWLLTGDEEAAKKVISGYDTTNKEGKKVHVDGLLDLKPPKGFGDSPSYSGETLTEWSIAYDIMAAHPDFKDKRSAAVPFFEAWGDYFKKHNTPGCVPFYCRNAAALAGLTAVALAIHGDSAKADDYLAFGQKYLKENLGTIRQAEDGASGGATYAYYHQFNSIVHTVSMFRTATDWDPSIWIRDNQSDWLQRQAMWQIWTTDPNGWFWKEGDIWSGSHTDKYQLAPPIDGVALIYRNGYAKAHSDAMRKRWGKNMYYPSYAWMFFINNDPTVQPKPLSELGLTAVFSPNLHGHVFWRNSWNDDAIIVRFKAGDNVDHHGTWDSGKFTLSAFGAPLAIKSGAYSGGYMGLFHHYYKLPWSANVVIFDHPQYCGWQKRMPDLDKWTTWESWKAQRDKAVKWPPAGRLVTHEQNDKFARALADMSGATWPTESKWTRELVFLGYKYLLVLDRVTPGKDVTTRWLLHSVKPATIDATSQVTTVQYNSARMFCKTLLPAKATFEEKGVIDAVDKDGQPVKLAYVYPYWDDKAKERKIRSFPATWFQEARKPEQQVGHGRVEIAPENPASEAIYLNVLVPTNDASAVMPPCSLTRDGDKLTVKVGELEYTFAK